MKPIKLKGFDKEPTRSWIVCWTITEGIDDWDATDKWQVFESYFDALIVHDHHRENPDVIINTMCAVMHSSDYEPHPAFREPQGFY